MRRSSCRSRWSRRPDRSTAYRQPAAAGPQGHRVVRHIDPWSTFKVALIFSIVLYGVLLTAGVLLWNVASNTGTVDNVERWFTQFGWESYELKGGEIFHNAWIAGLFGVIGLTGLGGVGRDAVQPDQRHGRRRARDGARGGGRRAHHVARATGSSSAARQTRRRRSPSSISTVTSTRRRTGRARVRPRRVERHAARLRNRQRDR